MIKRTLILIFGILIGIVLASSMWPKNRSPLIQFNARGMVRIVINRPESNE